MWQQVALQKRNERLAFGLRLTTADSARMRFQSLRQRQMMLSDCLSESAHGLISFPPLVRRSRLDGPHD
jgi:hypothetical protein